MMGRTYYEVLQVQCSASITVIKAAYKALSQVCHPDKSSGNAELMKELTQAYEVLSDTEKRKKYDEQLNFKKQENSMPENGISENITAVSNVLSAIIAKKARGSAIKFTWESGENKNEFGMYVFAENVDDPEKLSGVSLPYLAYYISKSLKNIK